MSRVWVLVGFASLAVTACSAGGVDPDEPDASDSAAPTGSAGLVVPEAASASSGPTSSDGPKFGGKVCTQRGCVDRWTLKLVQKDRSALVSGNGAKVAYTIEVSSSGKKSICTWDGQAPNAPCKGDLEATFGSDGLVFGAAPTSLDIAISRDGKKLLSKTVTPTVSEVHPNGPDCPPTCRMGEDELALP